MKFELLKQSHLKRNIIIGVIAVLIISAITLNFTRAKYRVTQSIPLVNGTINFELADLNAVAVYIQNGDDYSKSDTIPGSGYAFNKEKSYCTVSGEVDTSIALSYDMNTQTLNVVPLTAKGTKCYLYFDTEPVPLREAILANNEVNEGTPNFSNTTTTGMYASADNLGTSYYFRGAVTNNYVLFAGYYWRIIRINGDGSIRIIYDGTSAYANGESSADRQTGTSAYNSASGVYDTSVGVGYMYQTGAQRPSGQNSGTASTIKGVLDNWYAANILGKGLDDKVVSTPGFCNDREMASGYRPGSSGATFYYATYDRLYGGQPTLQCINNNDLYTTKIGLITGDEVKFAGGLIGTNNTNYYLYTGQYYWTMSPFAFSSGRADMFSVNSFGALTYSNVYNASSVRPVLNLSFDVIASGGDGTMNNPYVVA